jgi:hypothetical protein
MKKWQRRLSCPILFLSRFLLAGLCLLLLYGPAFPQAYELGKAPRFPRDLTGLATPKAEQVQEQERLQVLAAFQINPQNREESRQFFNNYYLATSYPDINWTGNLGTCDAGTTALSFRDLVLQRLNYFRAMAGVPAQVTFSTTYNDKCQKAALMMSRNDLLDHNPPNTWTCYTPEGAEAAGNSNLCLGANGWTAVDLYMKDPDRPEATEPENGAVGHRRWVLYPQTQQMGTGDIPYVFYPPDIIYPEANALWVLDTHLWDPRPPTREEFVAWPPPGYVPYQVVYPRWSFSYAESDPYVYVDFSAATVTMSRGGSAVSLTMETVENGYGENTLVWIPLEKKSYDSWPNPGADTVYQVTVSNVVIGGSPRTFNYAVTIFDPATVTGKVSLPFLPLLLD